MCGEAWEDRMMRALGVWRNGDSDLFGKMKKMQFEGDNLGNFMNKKLSSKDDLRIQVIETSQ